jgi:hypothetical protein
MALDLTGFEGLSPEELREAAKQLQNMAHRKEGGNREYSKERLSKLLDIESDNFLGTGMSLQDFMLCGLVEDINHSFVTQMKPERKRRLGFIRKLAAELDRILVDGHLFGSAIAEGGIGAVILGDWSEVKDIAEEFRFTDEDEHTRNTYAPIYANFVGLLQEAFDTRPEAEAAPRRPTH